MAKDVKKIAIIGASGFGREVADIALDLGYEEVVFLSKDVDNIKVLAFPVVEECLGEVEKLQNKRFDFAIGIGDPTIRKKISEKYSFLNYPNIIHPSVSFGYLQRAALTECRGNIIAAGCRFTNNIVFGNFGIFNINTAVGHDCQISDFVSVMSNVVVSGNVSLGLRSEERRVGKEWRSRVWE